MILNYSTIAVVDRRISLYEFTLAPSDRSLHPSNCCLRESPEVLLSLPCFRLSKTHGRST